VFKLRFFCTIVKKFQKKIFISFQEPWNRLFKTPTLASGRREIFHHDSDAPVDCLDFELKSLYDHHNQFLKTQKQVLQQRRVFQIKYLLFLGTNETGFYLPICCCKIEKK